MKIWRVHQWKHQQEKAVESYSWNVASIDSVSSENTEQMLGSLKESYTNVEKQILNKVVHELENLKNSITIFPRSLLRKIGEFNTQTLDDATVTQEIFQDYDLTMINVWGGFSEPSRGEMKELAELYEILPSNVNLISICADASTEKWLVNEILNENGCEFQTLIPDQQLTENLLNYVVGFPAKYFVDSSGNIVGNTVLTVGDKDTYMKEIQDRLDMLGIE